VLVIGVCIGDEDRYQRVLRPTIPANLVIIERRNQRSIFEAYNSILDEAPTGLPVVLVHEDVEIRDPSFTAKLRSALDDGHGLVGVVGAVGVRQLSWWSGERRGRIVDHNGEATYSAGTSEVDAVDGVLMAVSPEVASSVRFDEQLAPGFHGYDVDYSFEVRRAGWTVAVTDLDIVHRSRPGGRSALAYARAGLAFRHKWFGPVRFLMLRRAVLPLRAALGH